MINIILYLFSVMSEDIELHEQNKTSSAVLRIKKMQVNYVELKHLCVQCINSDNLSKFQKITKIYEEKKNWHFKMK